LPAESISPESCAFATLPENTSFWAAEPLISELVDSYTCSDDTRGDFGQLWRRADGTLASQSSYLVCRGSRQAGIGSHKNSIP
jgi:hypothetical protein